MHSRDIIDLILRKALHIPSKKPWMRYREIEILKEILKKLRPKKCLEWGAGYSTLYFPKLLPEGTEWISIEHAKVWAEKVKHLEPGGITESCGWTDDESGVL